MYTGTKISYSVCLNTMRTTDTGVSAHEDLTSEDALNDVFSLH